MVYLVTKLHEQMILAVRNAATPKKIGVAFSGGVDSSLLAKICSDSGFEVTLLTIGFAGSHDVEFSKKIATMMGLKHLVHTISDKSFSDVSNKVAMHLNARNLSWIENCIAFYYVSKLARKHGIEKVLTSNGIDELFCGYNAYRNAIEHGESAVATLMESKLDNETRMMKAVNEISSEFGVTILQPFLSEGFIIFAKTIPTEAKIKNKDDLVRKHIIREVALSAGVPHESALKRKKALQYGSLIHKNLIKVMKTSSMTF